MISELADFEQDEKGEKEMAYQALYRKYRPTDFDSVVGQKHIVQTLKNAIDKDRIAHAYLFTGPRGTGKTSVQNLCPCSELYDRQR